MKKISEFIKKHKKLVIFLIVILLIVIGISVLKAKIKETISANMPVNENEYATVSSGDVSLVVAGSGIIESSQTKNIASEVSAKVKQVNIEIGDEVKKGDVLFSLDSSDLDTQIRNKEKTISNYQTTITNYKKTISDYEEDISNLNVYSDVSGYVKNLTLAKGDSVNANAVLFEVIDNSSYIVTADFYYFENNPINVGDKASMRLSSSFNYIYGVVTKVSSYKEQTSLGGQMQEVEIAIENPGYTLEGLSVINLNVSTVTGGQVTSVINDNEEYTITLKKSTSFRSNVSGKVATLNISNGDYITSGMLLMTMENDDLVDKLNDTKTSLSTTQRDLNDAYQELEDLKDDYTFYTITSPIDGIITEVNVNVEDYVRAESTIAEVINNEKLQFEVSVDELDILKVKEGQEVKIVIDAIEETENTSIIGYVSEVGIKGNSMNNVTTYQVTITLDGREDIKIGMNCSAEIMIETRENVLVVPVEAVDIIKDQYYVVMEDGNKREIEVGINDEDNVEIISGLEIGEKVIVPEKVSSTNSSNSFPNPFEGGGF